MMKLMYNQRFKKLTEILIWEKRFCVCVRTRIYYFYL